MCVAQVGLVPWNLKDIEGHVAIWHVFVLVASGCFFVAFLNELPRVVHFSLEDCYAPSETESAFGSLLQHLGTK